MSVFLRLNLLVCIFMIAAASAVSIAAAPALAQGERRLTLEAAFGKPYIDGQLPGLMRISPDDKWLACVWADDARGYTELWLMSLDGTKRRKLTYTKEQRRKELVEENEKIEDVDDRMTDDEITEALERERNVSQIEWDKDCLHLWLIYRGDLVRLDAFGDAHAYPPMEKILKLDGAVGDIKMSRDGRYLGISMYSEIYIRDCANGALWKLTTDAWEAKGNYGLEWSESGRYLGFYQYDSNNLRVSWMADYMTKDVSPIPLTRPRPGDYIGTSRFGYIDLQAEDEPKVVLVETDDQNECYGTEMHWAPDRDRLLLSLISKDTETLSIWDVIDFDEGKAVKVFEYTDEAWFNDAYNHIYWGPGENEFICLLEKTGWSQVHSVDFTEKRAAEKAKYEEEKKKKEEEEKKKEAAEKPSGKRSGTPPQATASITPQTSEDGASGESDQTEQPAQPGDAEPAGDESAKEAEPKETPYPAPVQLTFGELEVTWMELLKDRRTAYLITSMDGPDYRSIHKFDIPSRGKKRITIKQGMYSFGASWGEGMRISESGRTAVVYGSDYESPASLYTLNLEKERVQLVLDARPPDWRTWRWVFPEHVTFTNIEHPGKVHALLYLPSYHVDGETRPVIVHIHGAGYAQDALARHGWFDGLHTYMADTLGYAVLDIDYRGSSGYGRDWRVEVAGQLGHIEDSDARAGVEYLLRSGIADMNSVGIWGWSYGGFQTNMSMFISPDYWKAGVSMAAVNDWSNYNHWYVTQRLDDPTENKDAYKLSSPITYAESLKGDLLMIHGILDDNVMVQDFMQLTAKLINKNVKFQIFVFPEDSHGINTTDRMIYFTHLVCSYFEDEFGRGHGAPAGGQAGASAEAYSEAMQAAANAALGTTENEASNG